LERDYLHIINSAKDAGKFHPGRIYSVLRDLYRPILYIGFDEYAPHLPPIPKWLWVDLQKEARQIHDHQQSRKRNRPSEEQFKLWRTIFEGNAPYGLDLV